MIEVLQFIFSSFWVWFGFTITSVGMISAIRGGAIIKYFNEKKGKR